MTDRKPIEGTIFVGPASNGRSEIGAGISMWDVALQRQKQFSENVSRVVPRLQGRTRRQKKINAIFLATHMCDAHGAYCDALAAYELSWPANFHWLYVEGLSMSQSKSTPAGEQTSTHPTAPVKNIVDTTIDAGNFTTLTAGLKAAGLTDVLSKKGPFTVFAPTDEAFRKLPNGALEALLKDSAKLKAVLNFHVITGHVSAKDMKTGEVMTLQGSPLTAVVSSSEVKINGAHMKGADMIATNGVVHAIDAVIMPRNWQLLAAAA
jgi:uncharacterized surface protein with fasciclin (FAS1) repeats